MELEVQYQGMAGTMDFKDIWRTVKEVDLRPILQSAERVPQLVIVGADAASRATLTAQLRQDPHLQNSGVIVPVNSLDLVEGLQPGPADLTILILTEHQLSQVEVRTLLAEWAEQVRKVLVLVTPPEAPPERREIQSERRSLVASLDVESRSQRLVYAPLDDPARLLAEFVPAVFQLLPAQVMALARHYPFFRVPAARRLISDTCLSNAAYAFSTGLAEIVPVFYLPLNVADIIVLTKAQAFLVYRLGLALGLSTNWRDYVAEFGGVLGGGFVWRQIARQMVGLIPAWGIIPKVAVSYAGTYVVGNVVLQWYLTGRHVSRQQMRQLYGRAFAMGKQFAQTLVQKLPQPRLRRKERQLLTVSTEAPARTCAHCGRQSAGDALFCQYCGGPFQDESTPDPGSQEPGTG